MFTSYSWNVNDDTIPKGWRSKELDGKITASFFLSPDGIQFHCRRAALQNLIKTMADPEEIIQMRGKLKHEGFEPSDKLPPKWLYCTKKFPLVITKYWQKMAICLNHFCQQMNT